MAATILTGIIQVIYGIFKLARYMKFIPRSVMVGFVNALAIHHDISTTAAAFCWRILI
nr:SulP family inorganic anion transporter [Oceanobacillus saliphilus]